MSGQIPIYSDNIDQTRNIIDAMFSTMEIPRTRDTIKAFLTGRTLSSNDGTWPQVCTTTNKLKAEDPNYFAPLEILIDIIMGVALK